MPAISSQAHQINRTEKNQKQTVKLVKKEVDRFLTVTEVSKVHALFGEMAPPNYPVEPKRKL